MRCTYCKGEKKVKGLGYIIEDCYMCGGTGKMDNPSYSNSGAHQDSKAKRQYKTKASLKNSTESLKSNNNENKQ